MNATTTQKSRHSAAGYSLIEVLVATALTGTVILSIMTLFFLARRNVYSGKQMSAANAVATRVLEDISLMTATDVLSNFNVTNSTTRATNTVGGISYPASVLRDTNGTIDATTDTSGYLARWKALRTGATFEGARGSRHHAGNAVRERIAGEHGADREGAHHRSVERRVTHAHDFL